MRIRPARAIETLTVTLGAPFTITTGAQQTILSVTVQDVMEGDLVSLRGFGTFTNAGVASSVTQRVGQLSGSGIIVGRSALILDAASFAQGAAQVQQNGIYVAGMCAAPGDALVAWQASDTIVNGDVVAAGATLKVFIQRFGV